MNFQRIVVGALNLMRQGLHHLQSPVENPVHLTVEKADPVVRIKCHLAHSQIVHLLVHQLFPLIVPGVEITGGP